MNTMNSNEWSELAWNVISALPGETSDKLRAQWDVHAARKDVVLTLFGPYDSGKSSLLKRLLVDEGRALPDWLTISARRETFEANEVEVAGAIVRDTPGIAGGSEQHDVIADESLTLSDVILVVLPPQLVTSGKDTFMSVLNGGCFRCERSVAYAKHGLGVVLSRMDEAGASPEDDPEGYVALGDRKAKEFAKLLHSDEGTDDVASLFITAADPSGLVGNSMPVDRSAYDGGRSWDGIERFAEFLHSLAKRKCELRQFAEVRFLGATLGDVSDRLGALGAERRMDMDAAAAEAEFYSLLEKRLGALLGSAKADLNRRIEEEYAAATRRGGADAKELQRVIDERMGASLARWAAEHDDAINALLREIDQELEVRRERPSSKTLWGSLGATGDAEPDAEHAAAKKGGSILAKGEKTLGTLRKGFQEAHQSIFGMTIQQSRAELQRLGKAGTFEGYVKDTDQKAPRFRDGAQAKHAKWGATLDAGLAVAPAIVELAGLLGQVWSEKSRAVEMAARREKAMRAIDESAKKYSDGAWNWWFDDGLPAAAKEALNLARQSAEGTKDALGDEVEAVERALKSVSDCLFLLRSRKPEAGC